MDGRPDYLTAIDGQPDALARSARRVRAQLNGELLGVLGTGRLAVVGMGASRHAAESFAAVMRAAGRPVIALSAAEPTGGLADAYLAISRSGRSRETVEALRALDAGVPRVALVTEPGGPLDAAADHVLALGCGADSRITTIGYSATVQALGLLRDALVGGTPADWDALPAAVSAVLSDGGEAVADLVEAVDAVDVVGVGTHAGTAGAVALLLREALRVPAAPYPLREYLHGPVEVAGPRRGVLVLGDQPGLVADLAGWGAPVVPVPPAGAGLDAAVLAVVSVQAGVAGYARRHGLRLELRHIPADTKL